MTPTERAVMQAIERAMRAHGCGSRLVWQAKLAFFKAAKGRSPIEARQQQLFKGDSNGR